MKRSNLFPDFSNWQDGYGAFTHSSRDEDRLIEYIKHQPAHHQRVSYGDELKTLLIEAGVEFDERILMLD